VGIPADHRSNESANSSASSSAKIPPVSANSSAFLPSSSPQLNPDHGLYGFFRRKAASNLRGNDQYETFTDPTIKFSGRAWLASELRLKNFKDLHTLWFVLLRERNLLATQREEMRRLGLILFCTCASALTHDTLQCRKSMARIKAVMNERRLAYEGAVKIAEQERE
ncbi:mitochondrial 39-S ribosomal protein L47 (MRP-L47)-domain-containing protein, partial [Mycena pura]